MSGLSAALSSALSGLMVTSSQSAVTSKNVTRANEEGYTRKLLELTTDMYGNVRAGSITRASEKKLIDSLNNATSDMAGRSAIDAALVRLAETVGDVEKDGSIAWSINQLEIALSEFESNPSNQVMAGQAVASANRLAQTLNAAASLVNDVRSEADASISSSVTKINETLGRIETLNAQITGNGLSQASIPDLMDQRDELVKQLSEQMGVRTVTRPDNGIALYTDSGVTLFDVSARSVNFIATNPLPAGASGGAVYIDGVQVTGPGAPMPLQRGNLVAQARVRDDIANTYQNQLDEVARGLISLFAESDQSAVFSDATGLFGYAGSPAVPPAGTLVPGLAGQITVNALFDPLRGGNPMLLRDGGANGAAYVYNINSESGFQGRLTSLVAAFEQNVTFSSSAGLSTSLTMSGFATQSAGWLEQMRSDSSRDLDYSRASQQRATEALSRKSGVNIDEEMATLLNLEKSYQASAKVMTTVDQMLNTLMQIVR